MHSGARPKFFASAGLVVVLALSACGGPDAATRQPKVLLVGDSLMKAASPEIAKLLGTPTHFVGADGTGPLTPQGLWQKKLEAALAEFRPDIVVIEACCNYRAHQPYRQEDGTTIQPDSPEMYREWERSLRTMITTVKTAGAEPFIVLTPDPDPNGHFGYLAERVRQLNDMYLTLGVPTIDWRPPVFVASQSVEVRAADGLHLTPWGNAAVARATQLAIQEGT